MSYLTIPPGGILHTTYMHIVVYHIYSEMHHEAELFHLVISLVTNCSNKWFAACYTMQIFKVAYHISSEMYCEVTISLTDCSHNGMLCTAWLE